jgi:insertion element IS1 protein InsB
MISSFFYNCLMGFWFWCPKLAGMIGCKFCGNRCQKAGKQANGTQRAYCSSCKKFQQVTYRYQVYKADKVSMIAMLVCESVSIRGIARVLKIAKDTVMKKILSIARCVTKPPISLNRCEVEVDEIRTYIGNKDNQFWVAYALCSESRQVIDFTVGKRSKRTLKTIVDTVLISGVQKIRTDNLNIYQSLIPKSRHLRGAYVINHIERNNLNLRTHLKRLSRRTICFSRSLVMLSACLKIYFWMPRINFPVQYKLNQL